MSTPNPTPNPAPASKVPSQITGKPPLSFDFQPQLLQHLGSNLYTKLDSVLIEFLANAHDADANTANVGIDFDALNNARDIVKNQYNLENAHYKAEKAKAEAANLPPPVPPAGLEARTLDQSITITIQDDGIGMTDADLQTKFLVVSRQRRVAEKTNRTTSGRFVMGRKGLGKLAGFGVAHKITIYSKTATANTAHRIVLDYDAFQTKKTASELEVPLDEIQDWQGLFPKGQGTIVELCKLVFASHRESVTIQKHIGKSFRTIKDFTITFNNQPLSYVPLPYAYEYPPNDQLTAEEIADGLAKSAIPLENGTTADIKYRIGFYGKKGYLKTGEYGLTVYCQNRMAAKADTFDISSSIDGYLYHTYMEGVVEADFIDEQTLDYIATNRQSLVWQGLLEPVQKFLHDKIEAAVKVYAKEKEKKDENDVDNCEFTKATIRDAKLRGKRRTEALKIAKAIAKSEPDGIRGTYYQKTLPVLIEALGNGKILTAMAAMAKEENPNIKKVVQEIIELTRHEYEGFVNYARGRLDGIEALEKIIQAQDFKKKKNEKEIQSLLEKCPWLIDVTFYQFLTANAWQSSVREELTKHLKIADQVSADYDPAVDDEALEERENKRPDLVFILGSGALSRIIIVELKAPNTPLLGKHLTQLKFYMEDVHDWLKAHRPEDQTQYKVEGILIGCRSTSKTSEGVKELKIAEKDRPDNADWKVLDLSDILKTAKIAHQQLIEKADAAPAES